MTGQEFVIALVAMGAGALVLIVGISSITSLIKAWMNRNKNTYDDEVFNRLAKAFTQHKKDTERRIQNLEAIIAEDDKPFSSKKQIEEPRKTIEIEDEEEGQEESTSSGSNLRNMLRE